MAYDFVNVDSDRIKVNNVSVGGDFDTDGISVSAWIRNTDILTGPNNIIFSLYDASDGLIFVFYVNDHTSTFRTEFLYVTDTVHFDKFGDTDVASADPPWTHVGATFDGTDATGIKIYVNGLDDGGSIAVNGGTPPGRTGDYYTIGASITPNQFFEGQIAELATWRGALTPDDFAMLGKGYSPLFLANAGKGLVSYAPLIRETHDLLSPTTTVITNTPTVYEHPPIIYPQASFLMATPAAAAPSGAIMNQLQSGNLGADLYNGTIL